VNYFKFFSKIKNSRISNNVVIGYLNRIYNSSIGDYTYVGNHCVINECKVGGYCSIASNVKIGMGRHPVSYISTSPLFYAKKNPFKVQMVSENKFKECEKTIIGSDVWIGINAIIKDGIEIEHGAIVGAGSVVTKDVPPYAVVAGTPAKIIKYRFEERIIKELFEINWWQYDLFEIKKAVELFSCDVTIEKVRHLKSVLGKNY